MLKPLFLLLCALSLVLPAPAMAKPKRAKKRPARERPAASQLSKTSIVGDEEVVPPREIPLEVKKEAAKPREEVAPILRLILKPIQRGMFIRLPVMDTDPNRGITGGVMPIWVLKENGSDRIEQIHAPSLTYNKNFLWSPTYRYYYYPSSDSTLIMRGSVAKFEREILGEYEDHSLMGTEIHAVLRVQHNVDAGQRFFGIGPATPKSAEANYKDEYTTYRVGIGHPILTQSKWRLHIENRLLSEKISNGPIPGLPGFDSTFPGVAPVHHQQTSEWRLVADYDSRDHSVTTSEGAFLQTFAEASARGLASSFDYNRYGLDGRYFYKWPKHPQAVTGANLKYEQLLGNAPFWLLPNLGGKYSHRAYGSGRYVDRGMLAFNLEQRLSLWQAKMAGVTTDFELAPFAGLGTVFDNPQRLAGKYVRPVYGTAIRAVARPQVVGSIDFGVGQEGLAVFMDINYSF